MQLEHSFTVPVGVEEAWQVLLDIERIAPCMPGAAIDSVDGDDFTGTVKVRLGPIGLTYKGRASFVEKDADAHRIAINAQGRDARGNGTAAAKVTATLTEQDGATHVDVRTDLDITGRPAQFGRGVMVDVGNKLIGQFADCLAGKLAGGGSPAVADAGATVASPIEPAADKDAPDAAADKAPAKKAAAAKKAPAKKAPAKKAPAKKAPAKQAPAKQAAATKQQPAGKATPAKKAAAKKAAPTKQVAAATRTAPATVSTVAEPHEPARLLPTPGPQAAEVEPINLLESAGPAIAKRLAPLVALVVLALILLRLRKR